MPFIEADLIDQTTTHFAVSLNGEAWSPDLPVSGTPAICRYDVSEVAAGTHTIIMKAIKQEGTWGRLESAPSVPFTFTRPEAPNAPTGIRLVP